MGLFRGRKIAQNVREPALLTQWLIPKNASGNDYNRVGSARHERPSPLFHGPEKHPWMSIMLYFKVRENYDNLTILIQQFVHGWRDRFGHVRQAEKRVEATPEEFTKRLRAFAADHPEADIVGFTRMRPEWMFKGQLPPKHPWIVVVAKAMDYDTLSYNLKGDFRTAVKAVMGGYERNHKAVVDIANWILKQGYSAKGYGGLTMIKDEWHVMIPPAIECGIGQLAKNGSMINDQLGSCFRLATVLTDMPFVADQPREIGVDEFCTSCKKCQTDCPPGAISNEKQLVRGDVKWYVDFDKCMPFLAEHKACGLCLSTCPWSRPGIAPNLSQKMLKKMARQATPAH